MSSAEREAFILARRVERVPFRTIAAELGISNGRVHQIFTRVRDRIPAQRLADLRAEEAELADAAIHDLLIMARNPNVSARTRCECWSVIRGWSESRRKLFGTDAPMKREINFISDETIKAEIERLTRENELNEARLELAAAEGHLIIEGEQL